MQTSTLQCLRKSRIRKKINFQYAESFEVNLHASVTALRYVTLQCVKSKELLAVNSLQNKCSNVCSPGLALFLSFHNSLAFSLPFASRPGMTLRQGTTLHFVGLTNCTVTCREVRVMEQVVLTHYNHKTCFCTLKNIKQYLARRTLIIAQHL